MKNILLILLTFLGLNSAFAQYEFSEIIGTYEGYTYKLQEEKDLSASWKIIISEDFVISLSAKVDGIWVEYLNEKSTPSAIEIAKDGSVYFPLALLNSSEFSSLVISIPSERFKLNAKIEGLNIALFSKKEEVAYFDMNKNGGNPILKEAKNIEKYQGSTATWENYTVGYYSEKQEGIIAYDKVINKFYYKKEENIYTVIGKINETDFMKIQYEQDAARKTFKLLSAPKSNPSIFDKAMIFKQMNTSRYVNDETNIQNLLAELLYELFNEKFKPKINKSTEKILFLLNETVYVGEIQNKNLNGKGTMFYNVETHSGHFIDNKKNGTFELITKEGNAVAHFDNGKKTGIWKMTQPNGDVIEIVFKDDEKVSSKIIKNPKKEIKHDLGILVDQNNDGDKLYVSFLDENSAIYKAGMRSGDSFYRINGEKVVEMNRADAQEKLTYSTTDFFELEFFAKVWDKRMIVKVYPKTNTYKKVKITANNPIFRDIPLKKKAEKAFTDYIAIDEKIANVMLSKNYENMNLATLKSHIKVINSSIEKLQEKQIKLQAELLEIKEKADEEKCEWLIDYTEKAIKNNQATVQYLNGAILNFTHANTFSTKDEIRNFMFGASDEFAFAKGSLQELKKQVNNATYTNCW